MQEDIVRLDMRLATLERTQADLRTAASRSETDDSQLRTRFAETQAEIDGLKSEISRLRGGVEETQHLLGEKARKADAGEDLRRLEARVRRIETYLDLQADDAAPPPSPTGGPVVGGATAGGAAPSSPPAQTPEELYQAAKRDFDRGDNETARAGFQLFLERHPKAANADNARFWLGETYYREQWYEKAILEYQEVIEKYPNGNKVAASLLKQGLAFANLGDKGNARLILKELIRKYPNSNEAKIARQKIEGMN